MKIKFDKNITKDTFYSILPMNCLLKCVALSNIHRKGVKLEESASIIRSLFYIFVFGLLNTFCLYHKMKSFTGTPKNGLVKFSDSIQLTYLLSYLEYIIDLFFVFKFGRGSLLRYFKAFDHIDGILGSPYYCQIRKTIIMIMVLSITVFICSSLFDYISWNFVEGVWHPILYSVDYLYFFLNMLTVLDVVCHVIQVEYRLKMIKNLLEDCSSSNVIKPIFNDVKKTIYSSDSKPLDSLKTLCYTKYLESNWFSRCYLLLLEQAAYVNTSYGLRVGLVIISIRLILKAHIQSTVKSTRRVNLPSNLILQDVLVYCANLLFNMINLFNLSIRIGNGTMVTLYEYDNYIKYLPASSSGLRASNYMAMAMILMYRCEQTYKQSERILETIDVLLTSKKCYSPEMKTNLSEFRNLLITRPIKFHAAKFFTMDYTLLVSLSSVVVTYTIIMLQSVQ